MYLQEESTAGLNHTEHAAWHCHCRHNRSYFCSWRCLQPSPNCLYLEGVEEQMKNHYPLVLPKLALVLLPGNITFLTWVTSKARAPAQHKRWGWVCLDSEGPRIPVPSWDVFRHPKVPAWVWDPQPGSPLAQYSASFPFQMGTHSTGAVLGMCCLWESSMEPCLSYRPFCSISLLSGANLL